MGDAIAIISVVASSTIRRADAYISLLRLFEKTPDEVSQDEWEHLTATVRAFASPAMTTLFTQWGDASRLTWPALELSVLAEPRRGQYNAAQLC